MNHGLGTPSPAVADSTAPNHRAPTPYSLIVVAVICAAALFSTYQLSAPHIARAKQAELERAVFRVLPGAVRQRAFARDDTGSFLPSTAAGVTAQTVYAGYDPSDRLVGFAIPAQGMGYQDRIGVLYGYDPDQQAIIGFVVLESRETPGLGALIASDPGFLANFTRLDAQLHREGAALAHPIEVVKSGKKAHPWQIDAITGATVSSQAVGALLGQSAATWLPALYARRGDFSP